MIRAQRREDQDSAGLDNWHLLQHCLLHLWTWYRYARLFHDPCTRVITRTVPGCTTRTCSSTACCTSEHYMHYMRMRWLEQCCGTVTFITVPVLTFEKLWFRFWFRFQLLKFRVPVPVPTFEKVTVPVPVPAPYLDHKKQIVLKKVWNFFDFLLSKLFYKEKVHKFHKFMVKCEWKKCLMKEIKYIILCLVPVPEP